ncbi:MAG: hypothetical protein QNJ88_07195 [Acidimicrobiia bacterium]|nr:hypothetical protein [Acidimicrobiia bacterium]
MTDQERSKALAELLATPLSDAPEPREKDDPRTPRPAPWGMIVALVIGAAVVLIGFALGRSDEPVDDTAPATTLAPPTTTADLSDTFPPGFTPVDDAVAVRVERIGESGDDLAVTMSSAVTRRVDAEASTPFTGGRWAAVLRDGSTVAARGQVVDPATPGVVTALFDPAAVAIEDLVALRLSERWFNQGTNATQELELSALPWAMPEPTLLDLGDGNQLIVESLELSETGGVAEWSLVGGAAAGVVSLEIAIEEGSFDGQPRVMIPIDRIDRFFFDPQTAAPEGRIELSGPTAADGTAIARAFAFWSVRLTVTAPAAAEIPVPSFES